jgi:hypothetical protein
MGANYSRFNRSRGGKLMKLYEFVDRAITAYMHGHEISDEVNDALVDVTDLVQASSIEIKDWREIKEP